MDGSVYKGDIEGKFLPEVQHVLSADRFGVIHEVVSYIEYYFDTDDLEALNLEMSKIEQTVGLNNIEAMDHFFSNSERYSDKIMLSKGLDPSIWHVHKKDYSDYVLGRKIRDCINSKGECFFTVEE